MEIQREAPEQIRVVLTLSAQDIHDMDVDVKTKKKYANMHVIRDMVEGILGYSTVPSYIKSRTVGLYGKRYKRVTKDHLALALAYLRKHRKVAPYNLQREHIMGWSYAVRSLDSLVRSGVAQCKRSGNRRTYYYVEHMDKQDALPKGERSSKASYPALLKERVANSIQLNGLMYMKDIANSVKMSLDEREHLREILDDLIGEGKVKDIHSKYGGHPRYAPIDMRIPNR